MEDNEVEKPSCKHDMVILIDVATKKEMGLICAKCGFRQPNVHRPLRSYDEEPQTYDWNIGV